MMLPRFCLSVAPAPVATEPAIVPLQLCLDLGIGNQACGFRSGSVPANEDGHPLDSTDIPVTSRDVGSFIYDQENCIYPLEWEDLSSFHIWHWEEEHAHSIELIASSTVSGGWLWLQKRIYVCACQLSGGPNKYQKKFPHCFQKISTKKTGCCCQIVIKWYHHMPTVLGRYVSKHDHDLGLSNIAYMRMSHAACETVRAMLIQQIDQRAIVHNMNIILVSILMHQLNRSKMWRRLHQLVAGTDTSRLAMSITSPKHLSKKLSSFIQRISSPQSYGLTDINPKIYLFFTRINWMLHHWDQDWIQGHLYSVSKLLSNWRHSGTLAIASLELTQPIILCITERCFYLWLWLGTIGDMVSEFSYYF